MMQNCLHTQQTNAVQQLYRMRESPLVSTRVGRHTKMSAFFPSASSPVTSEIPISLAGAVLHKAVS